MEKVFIAIRIIIVVIALPVELVAKLIAALTVIACFIICPNKLDKRTKLYKYGAYWDVDNWRINKAIKKHWRLEGEII